MLQYFPRRWIAEELGDIDQDSSKKPVNFFRMLAYVLSVLGIAGHAELGHPAAKTALDRRLFITAKIKIALLCKFL